MNVILKCKHGGIAFWVPNTTYKLSDTTKNTCPFCFESIGSINHGVINDATLEHLLSLQTDYMLDTSYMTQQNKEDWKKIINKTQEQ